jgi:hypothetical protein
MTPGQRGPIRLTHGKARWMLLAAVVLFTVGVVWTGHLAGQQRRLTHQAQGTATVLDVACPNAGRCSPEALVEFRTAAGQVVQGRVALNEGTPVRAGQRIRVDYDPAHRSVVQAANPRLQSLPPSEVVPAMSLILSVPLAIFGLIRLGRNVFGRRRSGVPAPG